MRALMSSVGIGVVALSLGMAPSAQAVIISGWDLTGDPGNQATEPASEQAGNITGSALTRGSGLGAAIGGSSFNSNGWDQVGGAAANDFISFGFTVAPGFSVDLDNLQIGTQSSGTGPGTLRLFSSVDGFTTPLTTFNQSPGGNRVDSTIDLSSLTGLTGTIEFRLIEFGNTQADGVGTTAAAGTFRISEFNGSQNVVFNGTVVTPIPFETDAAAWGAVIALGLFGGLRVRKQFAGAKSLVH